MKLVVSRKAVWIWFLHDSGWSILQRGQVIPSSPFHQRETGTDCRFLQFQSQNTQQSTPADTTGFYDTIARTRKTHVGGEVCSNGFQKLTREAKIKITSPVLFLRIYRAQTRLRNEGPNTFEMIQL